MKKQMITLAMTMLIGTTSVFGGATSVQAAPIQDNMSYCEITQEYQRMYKIVQEEF